MKLGVAISSTAHAMILMWGLFSLGAPAPLEVADVEALPVDIVPIEEITQSVAGEKTAKLSETPAPTPTKRPDVVKEAKNVGEAQDDSKSEPAPKPAEKPVEVTKTETPPPAPKPTPKPIVEPVAKPVEKETPAPTNEVAALNEPKIAVTEKTVSEEAPLAETGEQFASLSKVQAVPTPRPESAKPQKAETKERKVAEEPAKSATAASDKKDDPIGDITKALQSKEKPTSTGAKKSTQTASLGTKKPSSSGKLSVSELDALRGAIEKCWSVPAGVAEAEDIRATVTMQLAADGTIEGRPTVTSSGGEASPRRAFEGSVLRAVSRCAPYSLPKDKYDTWSEVVVNFSAAEMF